MAAGALFYDFRVCAQGAKKSGACRSCGVRLLGGASYTSPGHPVSVAAAASPRHGLAELAPPGQTCTRSDQSRGAAAGGPRDAGGHGGAFRRCGFRRI